MRGKAAQPVPGAAVLGAPYDLFLLLWGLPGVNRVGPLLVLALFVGGLWFDPRWRRGEISS